MSDERINHYYPASIIAWAFSKDKKSNLRKSKVNVINLPELINLLKLFKNSNQKLDKYIKNNKERFLYGKVTEEIFTSMNLKEPNDKEIQKVEQDFLKILQSGRFEDGYIFNSKEQEIEEDKTLIDFFKLSLKRDVLETNNFTEITEYGNDIDYIENMEWRILESDYDCAAISDLKPISTLFLNEELLDFLAFDKKFLNKIIYFLPVKSNQYIVIANDNDLIIDFTSKCIESDFKTTIFNLLFAQILMFSTYYIVVGENNWIIDLAINLFSDEEIRKDIINKRRNSYNLTRFFNNIHNLKHK